MATPRLTDRSRRVFDGMFVDLAQAKADGRKEDAARVAFALTEPMLSAEKALNAYKMRIAHVLETGNTLYGIAAVHAFQRDLASCIQPEGRVRNTLTHPEATMLLRAADIASAKAFWREASTKASPIGAQAFVKDFEVWLDEKLDEMDAEIALHNEEPPSPR